MKIVYYEGPPQVALGAAGSFRAGEPKEVEEKLATAILKKKSVAFYEEGKAPAKVVERFKKAQEAAEQARAALGLNKKKEG